MAGLDIDFFHLLLDYGASKELHPSGKAKMKWLVAGKVDAWEYATTIQAALRLWSFTRDNLSAKEVQRYEGSIRRLGNLSTMYQMMSMFEHLFEEWKAEQKELEDVEEDGDAF